MPHTEVVSVHILILLFSSPFSVLLYFFEKGWPELHTLFQKRLYHQFIQVCYDTGCLTFNPFSNQPWHGVCLFHFCWTCTWHLQWVIRYDPQISFQVCSLQIRPPQCVCEVRTFALKYINVTLNLILHVAAHSPEILGELLTVTSCFLHIWLPYCSASVPGYMNIAVNGKNIVGLSPPLGMIIREIDKGCRRPCSRWCL